MAVTAPQLNVIRHGTRFKAPIAATTTVYENAFAFFNTSGFLVNTISLYVNALAGVVVKQVVNGGSAGDEYAEIETGCAVEVTGSGFAQTSVKKLCYLTDNFTATLDATAGGVLLGVIEEYVSATKVIVRMLPSPYGNSTRTVQSVAGVHDTAPTIAELTAAFGAPAALGRGWLGSVDDADGDTNHYLVSVSDASFFFIKLTKAA
ncbi:MAG: hypothetical protein AB7G28_20690 [Pirellulales bacterium]